MPTHTPATRKPVPANRNNGAATTGEAAMMAQIRQLLSIFALMYRWISRRSARERRERSGVGPAAAAEAVPVLSMPDLFKDVLPLPSLDDDHVLRHIRDGVVRGEVRDRGLPAPSRPPAPPLERTFVDGEERSRPPRRRCVEQRRP